MKYTSLSIIYILLAIVVLFLGVAIGPNDDGLLEVSYQGTTLMNVTLFISIVSLIGFVVFSWKKR